MNMTRAYISLGALYSLLILLGVVVLLMGEGSMMALVQVAVGVLAVTGLWGYVLRKGFLNSRFWRPLSCFLGAGVVVQTIVLFTAAPSPSEITQLLIGIVFSTLLAFILYQYGDRDQDFWASHKEIEGGQVLGDLLTAQEELAVEKQEADRQAMVNISKVGERYRASIVRGLGESVERFEEHFARPSTLAFYIEAYTCITVSDFAKKYTDARA